MNSQWSENNLVSTDDHDELKKLLQSLACSYRLVCLESGKQDIAALGTSVRWVTIDFYLDCMTYPDVYLRFGGKKIISFLRVLEGMPEIMFGWTNQTPDAKKVIDKAIFVLELNRSFDSKDEIFKKVYLYLCDKARHSPRLAMH